MTHITGLIRGLSLWFAFTLFLLGCSSDASSVDTITLIGTADLQGMMEPSTQNYEIDGDKKEEMGGGISYIATILQDAKKENPQGTFILSSGDDLMGRYFHAFKGEAIYSLMSKSGYMLYAPGNHEFDKGEKVFGDALDYADFNTLCSDLLIKDTALDGKCSSYKIINAGDTKIGFFSLMTEDFPLITSPGKVKIAANNVTSAKKMVDILQEKKCDIIIALTHVGLDQDKNIAQNVDGIDVIFGGHSHEYTTQPVEVNETVIVNAGEQGSFVVRLDLPLDSKHHLVKTELNYTLIPVIAPVKKTESVQTLLDNYTSQLPVTVVLGKTTVEWDLTSDTLRKGESNVANLINDLLRDKYGVDIVMNNAGAFRGKKVYPAGDITDTMLHEIDEFSNNAYIMEVKGEYLRQILEHSASLYGEGGLMQASGLYYRIDLNEPAQVIHQDDDGSWVIDKKGERITDVAIMEDDGTFTSFDDKKNYKVLSNAYLVNHAGDGYFWFKQYGKNSKNTYTTFYTVMAGYLETHDVMDPQDIDGRLQIVVSLEL